MNQYKITHKFGTFVYNPKNRSHKIKWYNVGDLIDQSTYDRLSDGTKRHIEKVSKPRKKRANK